MPILYFKFCLVRLFEELVDDDVLARFYETVGVVAVLVGFWPGYHLLGVGGFNYKVV